MNGMKQVRIIGIEPEVEKNRGVWNIVYIYNKKSSGPRILPCGIPYFILAVVDFFH